MDYFRTEEGKMQNVFVLFEVELKDGKMQDYLERASLLKDKLKNAEGFIRAERFSSLVKDNKILSMTVWKDEASIEKWRNQENHRSSQSLGRDNDFIDYKITVVRSCRSYGMYDRKDAPIDSNDYFKL